MQRVDLICDTCQAVIDQKKGGVNLTPLRGGMTMQVVSPVGNASQDITKVLNFCNPGCLGGFAGNIARSIKAAPVAPVAAPAAAAQTASPAPQA